MDVLQPLESGHGHQGEGAIAAPCRPLEREAVGIDPVGRRADLGLLDSESHLPRGVEPRHRGDQVGTGIGHGHDGGVEVGQEHPVGAVGPVAAQGQQPFAVVDAVFGEEKRDAEPLAQHHCRNGAEGGGRGVHHARGARRVVQGSQIAVDGSGQVDGLVGAQLAVERVGGQRVAEQAPRSAVPHRPLQAVALRVHRQGAQSVPPGRRPALTDGHRNHQLGVGGEELLFEAPPGPAQPSGDPPRAGVEFGVVLGSPQRDLDDVGQVGGRFVPAAMEVLATTEYTTNRFSARPVTNWWAHVLTPPVTIGVGALGGHQDVDVGRAGVPRMGSGPGWSVVRPGRVVEDHGTWSGHVAWQRSRRRRRRNPSAPGSSSPRPTRRCSMTSSPGASDVDGSDRSGPGGRPARVGWRWPERRGCGRRLVPRAPACRCPAIRSSSARSTDSMAWARRSPLRPRDVLHVEEALGRHHGGFTDERQRCPVVLGHPQVLASGQPHPMVRASMLPALSGRQCRLAEGDGGTVAGPSPWPVRLLQEE